MQGSGQDTASISKSRAPHLLRMYTGYLLLRVFLYFEISISGCLFLGGGTVIPSGGGTRANRNERMNEPRDTRRAARYFCCALTGHAERLDLEDLRGVVTGHEHLIRRGYGRGGVGGARLGGGDWSCVDDKQSVGETEKVGKIPPRNRSVDQKEGLAAEAEHG